MSISKQYRAVAGSEGLNSGHRLMLQALPRTNRFEEQRARVVEQIRPKMTTLGYDKQGKPYKKQVPDHSVRIPNWKTVAEGTLKEMEKVFKKLEKNQK